MTDEEVEALERAFLDNLRELVFREADAQHGFTTRDKQVKANRAAKRLQESQTNLTAHYVGEWAAEKQKEMDVEGQA